MRIFKDLDRVEYLGSGIPRILESYRKECFHFSENFLRMAFPASVATTEQVEKLLNSMGDDEYSASDLMERVGLRHRPTFLYNYLQPALDVGLIEMTIPDKPKSRLQKYRLSTRGRMAKEQE